MPATTVAAYLDALPADRKAAMKTLRSTIQSHLPKGFKEVVQYGMPSWVVPHSKYPDGYHCKPEEPLPFLSIANQKNFVALYHMGIYADPKLLKWFETQWPKHVPTKLDMGKSCIRFKNPDVIPYELIGELVSKMTPAQWIARYETSRG